MFIKIILILFFSIAASFSYGQMCSEIFLADKFRANTFFDNSFITRDKLQQDLREALPLSFGLSKELSIFDWIHFTGREASFEFNSGGLHFYLTIKSASPGTLNQQYKYEIVDFKLNFISSKKIIKPLWGIDAIFGKKDLDLDQSDIYNFSYTDYAETNFGPTLIIHLKGKEREDPVIAISATTDRIVFSRRMIKDEDNITWKERIILSLDQLFDMRSPQVGQWYF